jgi:hypothetical protein
VKEWIFDSTSSRCPTRVQCCPCHHLFRSLHTPAFYPHLVTHFFLPMHHFIFLHTAVSPLQLSLHTAIHHLLPPRFPSASSFKHHISRQLRFPSLTSSHQSHRPTSHIVPPVTASRQSRQPSRHGIPPVTAALQARDPSSHGIPPVTASLQSRHPSSHGIPPVTAFLQSRQPSSHGSPPVTAALQARHPSSHAFPPNLPSFFLLLGQ